MSEPQIISWSDTKEIEREDGTKRTVAVFIPECCREGWESCPHVAKPLKKLKQNVGL